MQVFPLHLEVKETIALMERFGVSPHGAAIMRDRFAYRTFIVKGISCAGANALKQHLLSLGGEAAIPKEAITGGAQKCDLLFSLRDDRFSALIERLRMQCFRLSELANIVEKHLAAHGPWYDFHHDRIPTDRPIIMGILNVTPDSFSDGGRYTTADAAVAHAEKLIAEGADIIDIGGESSRPGALPVDAEEEKRRTIPVISHLRRTHRNIVISIDTAKATVAAAAIEAGADIVNDISALGDPAMGRLVADAKVPIVLMHMQGTPRTMQNNPHYDDILAEINAFFSMVVQRAIESGVARERIVIDPGFGFGKTLAHNVTLLKHLEAFSIHRLPILVGVSRKSFIGAATGRKEPSDRLAGTISAHTIALEKGAAMLRAHDVAAARDALFIHRAVKEATCF